MLTVFRQSTGNWYSEYVFSSYLSRERNTSTGFFWSPYLRRQTTGTYKMSQSFYDTSWYAWLRRNVKRRTCEKFWRDGVYYREEPIRMAMLKKLVLANRPEHLSIIQYGIADGFFPPALLRGRWGHNSTASWLQIVYTNAGETLGYLSSCWRALP